MPCRILTIAEADADFRYASNVIDRKLRAHAPDWWADDQLDVEREYCGLIPNTQFTRWRDLKRIQAPDGALRAGGYIGFTNAAHIGYDYPFGRKALLSALLANPRFDAVVLIRDMDDQPEARAKSLNHARNEVRAILPVALALPIIKREAWVLNGFIPQTLAEKLSLEELRNELGFDPCSKAEELTAMKPDAKRDAKRVLAKLISDRNREDLCWNETAWETLRARGANSGLNAFLEDIRTILVPMVTGINRPS